MNGVLRNKIGQFIRNTISALALCPLIYPKSGIQQAYRSLKYSHVLHQIQELNIKTLNIYFTVYSVQHCIAIGIPPGNSLYLD